MKKVIYIIVLLVNLLVFSGCYYGYDGKYPELYTVACNSIITGGFFSNGEVVYNPMIELIEEDSYGRKLFIYHDTDSFLYNTDGSGGLKPRVAVLISQYNDEKFVYYYPNYNYIYVKEFFTHYYYSSMEDILSKINEKDIEQLKIWNDWNKPINLQICSKSKIDKKHIIISGMIIMQIIILKAEIVMGLLFARMIMVRN